MATLRKAQMRVLCLGPGRMRSEVQYYWTKQAQWSEIAPATPLFGVMMLCSH
jgi:hypothetical protein